MLEYILGFTKQGNKEITNQAGFLDYKSGQERLQRGEA